MKVVFNQQNIRYYFERGGNWHVYGDGVGDAHLIGALKLPFDGDLATSILEGYADLFRAVIWPLTAMEKLVAPTEFGPGEYEEIQSWVTGCMKALSNITKDKNDYVSNHALRAFKTQYALCSQAEDEL